MSDGLSGAQVYRVDAGGQAFVLKIAAEQESNVHWHRALEIRRHAAAAGLTPPVVHLDEARRAVLTVLVVDRSFPALYRDPLTHERALAELGRALRRLHALPLPSGGETAEPAAAPWTLFTARWGALTAAGIPVPDFVRRTAEELLTEVPPESGRALVLSHNDVHPKNLVHDGARLYFMDWDAAGPNDPFYDLATIAVFLGMDGPTCRRLLSAYEAAAPDAPRAALLEVPLPARFLYDRRLIAALCGVGFLQFGFHSGYTAGAEEAGGQTFESTPALAQFYQRLRAGTLSLATGEGRWAFGLALVRESAVELG
jgi:aminoglycoside phosphotransferase (APT) family kinase protein